MYRFLSANRSRGLEFLALLVGCSQSDVRLLQPRGSFSQGDVRFVGEVRAVLLLAVDVGEIANEFQDLGVQVHEIHRLLVPVNQAANRLPVLTEELRRGHGRDVLRGRLVLSLVVPREVLIAPRALEQRHCSVLVALPHVLLNRKISVIGIWLVEDDEEPGVVRIDSTKLPHQGLLVDVSFALLENELVEQVVDSEGSYVRLDPTASDAGLYLLPPQFLANRTFDTITWEGAVEAARQAREERGGGMMAGVGNAAALSNARSADPAIVGIGANINWAQLSAAPNTAAAGADNDAAAVDTGTEAAAPEGDKVFTGITSQEECDAVSAAVSLGEHEEQVHALEAADAAVGVGVANFNGNGGFDHSRRGSQMGHHGEEEQRDNGEPIDPGGSIDV